MTRTCILTAAAFALAAAAAPAHAQTQEVAGYYQITWQVAEDESVPVRVIETLTDDAGVRHSLEQTESALRPHGGALRLNGRRMSVVAAVQPAASSAAGSEPMRQVLRPLSVRPIGPEVSLTQSLSQQALHSLKYVTVLCRLADTQATPHPESWYQDLLAGNSYPSLSHYWSEASEERWDLTGSLVVGWYDVPFTAASYGLMGTGLHVNLGKLAADCTAAADADVDFSQFVGENIQINVNSPASWGGGGWITVDGPPRPVPMTWMAAWATQATYGHEIGHSFGLPHSSGPYEETYDSDWDVMSGGQSNDGSHTVGTHTIGWHKYWLGWVPEAQTLTLDSVGFSSGSTLLQRGGTPLNTSDDLLVRIPLGTSTEYTIEVREKLGLYERGLPRSGVVIHSVDTKRLDRVAQVVDEDGNGNTNDSGSTWSPGESFVDAQNGIAISVLSQNEIGYEVLATRGGTNLIVDVVGAGAVTSDAALACDDLCAQGFPLGSSVVLTPVAAEGATFLGWSACPGVGDCTVTLNGLTHVTATFGTPVAFATETLPAGIMGAQYDGALEASGGVQPYAWAVSAGTLPSGISLDPASGTLRGIAEEAGVFEVEITVTAGAFEAARELSLTINRPTLARASVMQHLVAGGGALNANQVRYLDLVGNRNGQLDVGDVRAWLQLTGEVSSSSITGGNF